MQYEIEINITEASVLPLLVLASIGVFVAALAKFTHADGYTPAGRKLLPFIMTLTFPFLIVTSIGPALLATVGIVNRLHSGAFNIQMVKEELFSGALALRLSSVLIAFHIVRLEAKRLSFVFDPRYANNKLDNDFRQKNLIITETQYLFYGVCAAALWQNLVDGRTSFVAAFASWALIYILDDWTVIQEYLVDMGIAPSKWLYYKVFAFNVVLLVSLIMLVSSVGLWMYVFFLAIPMLCIGPFWAVHYSELRSRISS